ncbi:MAG: heme-binding protein [Candidatus Planktophila sp.]
MSQPTTGNFTSSEILKQEESARFETLNGEIAIGVGERAALLAASRNLPITISVELDGQEVFRKALPGADDAHAGWITRKANVVRMTGHSTMFERVRAEELEIDWHEVHGMKDETHAIHGGGFPLTETSGKLRGILLISGLPQVEDHLLAVEVLSH